MADKKILVFGIGTDEVVEIPYGDLPAEAEDLLEVFKAEVAPLSLWVESARAYLQAGQVQQFLQIVTEGTGKEVEDHFGASAKYERIQLLCALGSYNTTQAGLQSERTAQNAYFATASTLFSKALAVSYHELLPHLGLGQLALARRDYDAAQRSFEEAVRHKNNGKQSIAGVLALANLHFQRSNFSDASKMYSQALRRHPESSGSVRIGLALCYMRMNNASKARAVLERMLQLEPDSCPAMLGLASLALGAASTDARRMAEGLDLLCRAFSSNPSHPGVINLLARYCLIQGDYGKAKQLALHGQSTAETPAMKADSLLQLARAHHALAEWRDAFKAYSEAKAVDSRLPLPLLGLAQMHLIQKDGCNTAIGLLESALGLSSGWQDALQLLGALYPHAPARKPEAALQHFRDGAQHHSADAGLLEAIGELSSGSDLAGALKAYATSLELHRQAQGQRAAAAARRAKRAQDQSAALDNGHAHAPDVVDTVEGVPARLLNNAAVLHMRAGHTAEALALLAEAMQTVQAAGGAALPEGSQVTLGYNLARVREASGQLQEAAREYQSILDQFPGYLACQQRLAALAQKRGNYAEAERRLNEVLQAQPDDADTLAALGAVYLEQQNFAKAEECLGRLLKSEKHKKDPYGWQALGTLHLLRAQAASQSQQADAKQSRDKAFKRALEQFMTGIHLRPGNMYAAHGIGAVLAEQGHLQTANTIFTQVQEAVVGAGRMESMLELAANTASLQLATNHLPAAEQQYASIIRRFYHGASPRLLLYLARTQYHNNQVLAAKTTLLKALHQSPGNHILRFDAALALQEAGQRILGNMDSKAQAGELRRVEDYHDALSSMQLALKAFQALQSTPAAVAALSNAVLRGAERLKMHVTFCDQTVAKARIMLQQAHEREAAREAREAQSRAALQAAQRRAQLEAERKAAQEAAAKAEREARAEQAGLRLAALKGQWAEHAALQQAAEAGDADRVNKARKKKKQKAEEDDILASDNEDEEYREGAPDEDVPQQEEPEQENGVDSGSHQPEQRKAYAGTGLSSSDEEDEQEEQTAEQEPDAEEQQEAPEAGTSVTPGRLRKRQRDDVGALEALPAGEDLGEDVLEPSNVAGLGNVDDGTEVEPQTKRSRAVLFDESDDE